MQFDLNFNLKTLDGKEDIHLGQQVGKVLYIRAGDIEPIKAKNWAQDLYNKLPIDIDKNELEKLKKFIKSKDAGQPVVVQATVEEEIIKTINQQDKNDKTKVQK